MSPCRLLGQSSDNFIINFLKTLPIAVGGAGGGTKKPGRSGGSGAPAAGGGAVKDGEKNDNDEDDAEEEKRFDAGGIDNDLVEMLERDIVQKGGNSIGFFGPQNSPNICPKSDPKWHLKWIHALTSKGSLFDPLFTFSQFFTPLVIFTIQWGRKCPKRCPQKQPEKWPESIELPPRTRTRTGTTSPTCTRRSGCSRRPWCCPCGCPTSSR